MQPKTIGDRIRECRCKKNKSVFQLAKEISVGRATIYRWESNETEPTSSELAKISDSLAVTCDYLAKGK